jgi:acyl-CoA thioester hydrolase
MEHIFYEGQIIWAMTDANGHLRHSAYADFAAQARVGALNQSGFTQELFKNKIGPILFREELIYLKELHMNDFVKVSAELTKTRSDYSRFSIKSIIYRASDGVKCAEVNVDGAWLDLEKRKLASLSDELKRMFEQLPKTENLVIE